MKLYNAKTKVLKRVIKRHMNKFPERYMFQLNELEFKNICGPNLGPQVNKIRTMPYAFTEQGVAMLATILKTPVADIVSMKIYDAYSLLIDIFKEAKEEIIIIDNYADKSILGMITNLNVKVTIVTRKFNLLKDLDIKKYNKQYHNLKVIYSDKFHDRFVIVDKKVLYHSGASFKDLGNKCFAINKIEDNEYLKNILKKIKE